MFGTPIRVAAFAGMAVSIVGVLLFLRARRAAATPAERHEGATSPT